jgi:CubicO group peptidase (beta-lactamase class C family)
MSTMGEGIDRLARTTGYSGVVRVDCGGAVTFAGAYGLADRRCGVANALDTRFAIASGTKGLTALTVMRLVERGDLTLSTPVREILGDDLPLLGADVTVEHLLSHRSGIGDYLNEDEVADVRDYVMPVPVNQLATSEQYLAILDGFPSMSAPGETFAYNNGAFVVLAVVAERVGGAAFHELVRSEVCAPAGMTDTEFLRSDELPARAALGYLDSDGLRTNVLHLPVRGSGDGGIYSTAADLAAFWTAFYGGGIVGLDLVEEMVRPRSVVPTEKRRYGLGLWLHARSDAAILAGYDAGVSFESAHDPATATTYTVISNTSEGGWPVIDHLRTTLMP